MKRLTGVALALLALFALVACGSPTSAKDKDDDTVTPWKIKSIVDGWQEHELTYDQINDVWTYSFEGMYATTYRFALVNPSGAEVKYSGSEAVALDTEFTMGGSNDVLFVPAKVNYTVQVNPTSETAPLVTLVGSGATAPALDEEGLAKYLFLKGNAFSIGWTNTAGTYSSGTKSVSWDVTHSNKNGEFGLASLDNFLNGITIDLADLTEGGAGTDDQTLTTGGSNAKLSNAPQKDAVYTITVTMDVSKTVAQGRYLISAALKTDSDTDWPLYPDALYFVGTPNSWSHAAVANYADGVGSVEWTAPADGTAVEFKFTDQNGWSGTNYGVNQVIVDEASIALGGSDNITFTATAGTTYTFTADFSACTADQPKPTIKVIAN